MTTYNGWTNYETWAVKLWIDNEEYSYRFWKEQAQEAWKASADKSPNQFMNRRDNAQSMLAEWLKDQHEDESIHPVFKAAEGSVFADLLNAALSDVNWHEIANAMLDDEELVYECELCGEPAGEGNALCPACQESR